MNRESAIMNGEALIMNNEVKTGAMLNICLWYIIYILQACVVFTLDV